MAHSEHQHNHHQPKHGAGPDPLNHARIGKLIDNLSWNFTEGNILDYGCGPGGSGYNVILPKAESTNSQMYSVDISPKWIELAQQTRSHPRIHYKVGVFPDNFAFPEIKFDRILSLNVFHLVDNVGEVLDCLVNALMPGGQLAFTTFNFKAPGPGGSKCQCDWKKNVPDWGFYGEEKPEQYFRKIFIESKGLKELYFEVEEGTPYQEPETAAYADHGKKGDNHGTGQHKHDHSNGHACGGNNHNHAPGEHHQHEEQQNLQETGSQDKGWSPLYISVVVEKAK